MRRFLKFVGRLLALGVVFAPMFALPDASAQKTSDSQVKAAYLYNFAKFVEWPASKFPSNTAPIRFCVFNDFPFEAELGKVVAGRTISGHPIEVIQVRDAAESVRCHVLFINSVEDGQNRHLLPALRDANVLTVGETNSFIEAGGIINFVLDQDHVQFQINHKAAGQAGLYVSSRLLSVARRVVE